MKRRKIWAGLSSVVLAAAPTALAAASGPGTPGVGGRSNSTPGSSPWKSAVRTATTPLTWRATTRRVAKLDPSRVRSTA